MGKSRCLCVLVRHVTTNSAKLKLSESWYAGFVDSAEGLLVLLVIRQPALSLKNRALSQWTVVRNSSNAPLVNFVEGL